MTPSRLVALLLLALPLGGCPGNPEVCDGAERQVLGLVRLHVL